MNNRNRSCKRGGLAKTTCRSLALFLFLFSCPLLFARFVFNLATYLGSTCACFLQTLAFLHVRTFALGLVVPSPVLPCLDDSIRSGSVWSDNVITLKFGLKFNNCFSFRPSLAYIRNCSSTLRGRHKSRKTKLLTSLNCTISSTVQHASRVLLYLTLVALRSAQGHSADVS